MNNIFLKMYIPFCLFISCPAFTEESAKGTKAESYEALESTLKGQEYTANTTMAMTYLERAKRRQKDGDYDTANADYEKAMKFDPALASQYPELGISMKAKDWMRRASDCLYPGERITCYQKAIQIDPKFLKAYQCLGREYYADKKYKQAAEILKKLLELNPEDKEAQKMLQKSLKKAGN